MTTVEHSNRAMIEVALERCTKEDEKSSALEVVEVEVEVNQEVVDSFVVDID